MFVVGWMDEIVSVGAPKELMNYIHFLEQQLETPIKIVSVGPDLLFSQILQ